MPKLSDVVAVVLDACSTAEADFFQHDLALVCDVLLEFIPTAHPESHSSHLLGVA